VYVSSPPADVSYFYNDLSPYGTWVQLDGVGWCWQPRVVVVNHAWRPYCDAGHWVWTDAGWFWQSDYSWGWAAFHYGRWQMHPRCGWVWLPDRTWGPSWVVWRSQGDHCGWAPLPPHSEFMVGVGWRYNGVHVAVDFDFGLHADHFTFIATKDFHQHDYVHYRMPPTQVTQIYNHTTIINNYVVNNTTIVNKGIRAEQVAAATHTPVKQVHIRDVPAGAPRPSPARTDRNELVVYRPQLKAPAKPTTMVAQKIDDHHPVIQQNATPPGRNDHTSGPGNSPWAPANGNRRQPTETPAMVKSGPDNRARPNPSPAALPTPKSPDQSKPATRLASASEAPSATHGSAETRPQPDASAAAAREGQNKTYNPVHTGSQAPQNAGQGQSHNSGQYYPKGYHQAAETHALPPVNQSQGNQPQGDRPSQPGNGHGQPRKNEQ
jgi:hypothetical protein